MILSMSAIVPFGAMLSFKTPEVQAGFKASLSAMPMPGMGPDMDMERYMNPQESDYIHVPIRALTATSVQGGIIDFGYNKGKALKEAVPMFNGLTVFKDHEWSVDKWLGLTSGAYWDEITPGAPPGVNMMLDVDSVADPKAARGLLTGALNSGSVTIKFDYEQSHPDLSKDDFLMQLGDTVNGQVVRALVTKVTRLMEYSVVWQGADHFAKVIGDDGKIHTPGQSSNSLSLNPSQENPEMDLKQLCVLLGLTNLGDNVTLDAVGAAVKSQNITATALAEAVTAKTTAEASLATAQTELSAEKTKVTELTESVNKLTTDLAASTTQATTLQNKVKELTTLAEVGTTFLATTRTEALRLYNLVENDKGSDSMRALIQGSDLSVAQSFVTSYKDRAEQVAPLKCTACGSTQLSRGNAIPAEVPPVETAPSQLETERLKSSLASIHGK
jgi:hypothetical protein